jgi:hypothetical protein
LVTNEGKTKQVRNIVTDMDLSRTSMLGFSVLGALCIVLIFVDDFRATATSLEMLGTAVFGALSLIAGLPGTCMPRRLWDYGIEMVEGGFLYYVPLRKAVLFRYADIVRIVAETRSDGDDETFTQLRIYARDADARLDEGIIFGTRILDEIEPLPGFKKEAWPSALSAENCPKLGFFAKKTVLLDSTKQK